MQPNFTDERILDGMDLFDTFIHGRMQAEINQNRSDNMRSDQSMVELEARVRALEKTTRALWALLKTKADLTDDELIEHAKAPEAQDSGCCPSCGRRLLVQHLAKCSWCGQSLTNNTLADGV